MQNKIKKRLSIQEFNQLGEKLFGKDRKNWKFICPQCKGIQSIPDFLKHHIDEETATRAVYQECIGRHVKGIGCDWCSYGLFKITNTIVITKQGESHVFDFCIQ